MRISIFTPLLLILLMSSYAAGQVKLGTIGDSLLDEYFDQSGFGTSLSYAKNSLELLVQSSKIDMGPTGNWGGTRKTGYEYNWALAGSTTETLISDGQHTNLAAQIGTERITHAFMTIGSNDLFPEEPTFGTTGTPGSFYEAIYEGLATAEQIEFYQNQAIDRVITAAQTLKDTGVILVVGTTLEYGISPLAKTLYTEASKRNLIDNVYEDVNQQLTQRLTQEVGVTVVDFYGLSKDIWGDHGSENAVFELGGVAMDLDGTGGVDFATVLNGTYDPTSVTSDTVDVFAHDGIHPNSAIGGIFANLTLAAFNQAYFRHSAV